MDIERHTNNRPLTYIGSDGEEDQVLTPNLVMWGQDAYILEDMEVEEDKLTRFRSTDDCKFQTKCMESLAEGIPSKPHGKSSNQATRLVDTRSRRNRAQSGRREKPRTLEEGQGNPNRERSR